MDFGEADIWTLLAEAQMEMQAPRKDKTGQIGQRSYKYASLDACLDSVRPPLNKRGVFLSQYTVREDGRLYLMTAVRHRGETYVLDSEPYEYDASPQEYGKRETYAKRYGLCKAFAIVGDEDTDGDVQGPPQSPQDGTHKLLVAKVIEMKGACAECGADMRAIDDDYNRKYGNTGLNRLGDAQLVELLLELDGIYRTVSQ